MKVYLPNISTQEIGGGWTFLRNIKKGLKDLGATIVDKISDADIMLVCGVTLTSPEEVEFAKRNGVKIVFRVDSIPRKSRNKRSRVYANMRSFAHDADMVVFQSEWARHYAGWLMPDIDSMIIYNGVDTKIFRPGPVNEDSEGLRYLYVNYNRDENKRFPEAAYHFHMAWRGNNKHSLSIVGNFSPELIEANFDFFADEDVAYLGVIADQDTLAAVYRDHDILLFPAFADAAPNTVLEARACGLRIELINPVGGTKELMQIGDLSLERMAAEYYSLFNLLLAGESEVGVG